MVTIKLNDEYVGEVFEILCQISFEMTTVNDNEPEYMRHPGIEQILTELQIYICDAEMDKE